MGTMPVDLTTVQVAEVATMGVVVISIAVKATIREVMELLPVDTMARLLSL